MKSKMKRSLYFTKTFLFSFLLYLSVVYSPIVNYIYDKQLTKEDFTALLIGTFSFLGVSQGRMRVNDDIRKSVELGEEVGVITTKIIPSKSKS
jgi:hypothetical protein